MAAQRREESLSANSRTVSPDELTAEPNVAVEYESDEQARAWLAAAVHHQPRVVAYVRCATHEPTEVADLLV